MTRKDRHWESSIKIGENLKRLRVKRDMTQDELAAKVEVFGKLQIQKWENGEAHISMPTMHDICVALGCSYNQLLEGAV